MVYVVLKNSDFNEGRGPMRFYKVFEKFEDAEKHVMKQSGIFGSEQYKYEDLSKNDRSVYNGYEILATELEKN